MRRISRFSLLSVLVHSLLLALTAADTEMNETETSDALALASPFPSTPSQSCLEAKTACENDTDCYHRLFYSHTTCVSGACKPQCKTAVLRLYETKLGRQLLHSDFSCLGIIVNSVVNCQLDARSPVMHCTLSKLTCELDDECSRQFDELESTCEQKSDSLVECALECAKSLFSLLEHSVGRTLGNCTCWSDDDALCQHMKGTMIDACKTEVLEASRRMQQNIPVTDAASNNADQSETSVNDFRNSNVMSMTKKPKPSDPKKSGGADLRFCGWCLGLSFVMLLPLLVHL